MEFALFLHHPICFYFTTMSSFLIPLSSFLLLALSIQQTTIAVDQVRLYGEPLPKDFVYGCGVTAYQVEGAWNVDGKGLSIWDQFTHEKGKGHVKNDATGDVAMDFYHSFQTDIPLFKKSLGINNFDFTMAWTRLLPNGKGNKLNEKGVEFYKKVIKTTHDQDLTASCTLYHWNLPAALQHSYGGWKSKKILDDFHNYASLTLQTFGQDCDRWISMNEPRTFCTEGYGGGEGESAPGIKDDIPQMFTCMHHALLAHANAYHEFKRLQNQGTIKQFATFGIKIDGAPAKPSNPNKVEDQKAAEISMAFGIGWELGPLTNGEYPELMRKSLERNPKDQDVLPQFTQEQKQILKDSYDLIYYDAYTSTFAAALPKGTKCDSDHKDYWPACIDEENKNARGKWIGKPTGSDWNFLVNDTIFQGLHYMHKTYNVKQVQIGENGMVLPNPTKLTFDQKIQDDFRIEWYKQTLQNIRWSLDAGIPLTGFIPWSCIRNFEWSNGYIGDFGLIEAKPGKNKRRTPKRSSVFLRHAFTGH